MKVQDVMTAEVGFCRAEDNLANAAHIMWEKDCGAVPILDAENRVAGMITDRDICIALGTRDRRASEIGVGEFCRADTIVCAPDDKLKAVLKKMAKNQIKRLPVVSQSGELIGIISLTDILLTTDEDKKLRKTIVSALTEISKPQPILLTEIE
ncbi:MAG TPA: CBS domain-containing protein [Pyrinomonadaceae bacterium]